MATIPSRSHSSVYGPVQSWRYGRSLGIDPIGIVSTCSFDCVYCQLGAIENKTSDRQIYVPTLQILQDLLTFSPWEIDVITMSGSGEPTLAFNLGEILAAVKALTHKPIGVLTNGTLLTNPIVREELAIADWVAVKIDAVSDDQLRRVNRPVIEINLLENWAGLRQFRQRYQGKLAIQTMLTKSWSDRDQAAYLTLIQTLSPDEIQLNTPTRPRPLRHQLDARGNHSPDSYAYPVRQPKAVKPEELRAFGDRIQAATQIPVRLPF